MRVHPLPGLVLNVALITSDQFLLNLLFSQHKHKEAAA